jgi:hypothetical protein
MYIDKQTTLGTAQAVTASAGTTDYYDSGSARDLGVSNGLYMVFTCTEAATATGSATVVFAVECDDNTSFSSVKQPVLSAAIGKATLIIGYVVLLPIPMGLNERYIRGSFTVATGPLTAGKFTTQIVKGVQSAPAYPDGI